MAQELRRRLGLDLFNFDLLHPSPKQHGAHSNMVRVRCVRQLGMVTAGVCAARGVQPCFLRLKVCFAPLKECAVGLPQGFCLPVR